MSGSSAANQYMSTPQHRFLAATRHLEKIPEQDSRRWTRKNVTRAVCVSTSLEFDTQTMAWMRDARLHHCMT